MEICDEAMLLAFSLLVHEFAHGVRDTLPVLQWS
jgi:hypothetical protein